MRVESLACFVIVLCAFPASALADPTVELERLSGDPQGRATATLRRALEREGIDVVEDGGAQRIEGRVSRGQLSLRIEGPDGTREVNVRGPTLNELARRAARELASQLPASAPAERAPEPRAERARDVEPERETRESARSRERDEPETSTPSASPSAAPRALRNAQTALALDLAFTEVQRDLVFRDDLFDRLADYHARFAPALRIAFEWFPAAHAGARSPLSWIGVGAAYDRVIGYQSQSADGRARFPTRASSWDVDVRYRIPIANHALTAMVGYGQEAFYVEASGPTTPTSAQAPSVPPTNYGYVRLAADAYLHVAGGLYFGTTTGMRFLTQRGGLDAWFPENRGIGFELGARFTYHVGSALRIGLAADYHRYIFGLNPNPGDFYVAGGAHDNFLRVSLFVGVRMPELK